MTDEERRERLERKVRDNSARRHRDELERLVGETVDAERLLASAQVSDLEVLIAERQAAAEGVSRRRRSTDLRNEAAETLARFAELDGPVMVIAVEPTPFVAASLPDASWLARGEALLDAMPAFAVVAPDGRWGARRRVGLGDTDRWSVGRADDVGP